MGHKQFVLLSVAVIAVAVMSTPASAVYTLSTANTTGGFLTYTFEDYARWDRAYGIYARKNLAESDRVLLKENGSIDADGDGTAWDYVIGTGEWWLSPPEGNGNEIDLDWDGTVDWTAPAFDWSAQHTGGGHWGGGARGRSGGSPEGSSTYLFTFERGRVVNGPGADLWFKTSNWSAHSVGIRYDVTMDGTPDYFGCGGRAYADSAGRPNMAGLVDLSGFGLPDGAWVDAAFVYGSMATSVGSWGTNVNGGQETTVDMNGDGTIDPKITPEAWNYMSWKPERPAGMGVIYYVLFGDGDIDGNGAVGLGDFSIFAGTYGKQAEVDWDYNRAADIDENRVVGLGDFSLFAGLYGTTYTYKVTGMDAVPEPTTLALLAAGALALVRHRRL
jgi:hypothetical protein